MCMYVSSLFLRSRSISQTPYYEKYIKFCITVIFYQWVRVFSFFSGTHRSLTYSWCTSESAFLSNSFCWGTYFLKIFLILRKKVTSGVTDSMPHPPNLFFGVIWLGIVSWSEKCTLLISGNHFIFTICTCFFLGGVTYIFVSYQLLIDVFVFAASSTG